MIVHGTSLSPFVRKVLVLAAEKQLDFESVHANPGSMSAEFVEISPFRKIPAFEDGDYKLCDSSAIAHYLDAQYPEIRMIPTDPRDLGRVVWLDEYADTIMFAAYVPIFFNRVVARLMGVPQDLAAADKAQVEAVPNVLDYLERSIPESGFLVGDRMTLADISVCSPLVNGALADCPVDAGRFPKVAAYAAAIHARPSFAAIIASNFRFLGK